MRTIRRERFAALSQIPDQRLDAMTEWVGRPVDVRFVLLHLASHEQEHALQLDWLLGEADVRPTKAQRLLGAAERSRGDLWAVLLGLGDDDLDVAPPGEWSLRTTLDHIINAEERYLAHCRYAVACFEAGRPWEPPSAAEVPPFRPTAPSFSFAEFVAGLDAAREDTIEQLGGLSDAALKAPNEWAGYKVDLDFRLRRFAAHEREHTAQITKWRMQVGRLQTEAERILGLAWRERGVLQGQLVGVADAMLDREINPEQADMTLRRILEHIIGSESYLMGQAQRAG